MGVFRIEKKTFNISNMKYDLFSFLEKEEFKKTKTEKEYKDETVTKFVPSENKNALSLMINKDINMIMCSLESISIGWNIPKEERYLIYSIPKKSGGSRVICEPCQELKHIQYRILDVFEKRIPYYYHNSAFAYVKNRSPLMAIVKHRNAKHKYFMKLDFHDFFGSINEKNLSRNLRYLDCFQNVNMSFLRFCMKDDALPQGAPTSPILSNLYMVEFDYLVSSHCYDRNAMYTRYADDIIISADDIKTLKAIKHKIVQLARVHGLKLNNKKTRIGSINGSNWNLGVMLNKNNEITLGHKNMKKMKAMINNFILDYKNKNIKNDAAHLNGLVSYYLYVNPDKMNYIIDHFNQKYNVDFLKLIRC